MFSRPEQLHQHANASETCTIDPSAIVKIRGIRCSPAGIGKGLGQRQERASKLQLLTLMVPVIRPEIEHGFRAVAKLFVAQQHLVRQRRSGEDQRQVHFFG